MTTSSAACTCLTTLTRRLSGAMSSRLSTGARVTISCAEPSRTPTSASCGSRQKSSFRLNHWLPGDETYPKVMQRTADFHDLISGTCLPQAARVLNNATALDAAVDMLDADATACDAPIHGFLGARE